MRFGILKHRLHRPFGRGSGRGREWVDVSCRDESKGKYGKQDRKKEFHYRASLSAGSVTGDGNAMGSETRRLSGKARTRNSARILLPIGSVPQSRPSNSVGGVPYSILCAGGIPSFTHRARLPRS